MKTSNSFLRYANVVVAAVALSCTARNCAAAPSGTWQPLFDGHSLAGWKPLGGAMKFEVRDGAIVGTTTAGVKRNGFLATEDETFGDFIFEGEFKCDRGINSGVQFRSSGPDDKKPVVHGYQYEIDATPRALTGGIQEESGRAWLAPKANNGEPQQAWVKAHGDRVRYGEWNQMRIEARGTHLRTWLNGQLMADIIDDADVRIRRGFFALQVHHVNDPKNAGHEVAFRNLRVERLD